MTSKYLCGKKKTIEARIGADLKRDVCMKGRAAELQNLESGTDDIADVGEWLGGDIKMPTDLREQKEAQNFGLGSLPGVCASLLQRSLAKIPLSQVTLRTFK